MTVADDIIDAGPIFILAEIEAEDGHHLRVGFSDGEVAVVDLPGLIFRSDRFAPIRTQAAFARVHLVDGGAGIAWNEELDVSAEVLRAIAREQRPMPETGSGPARTRRALTK